VQRGLRLTYPPLADERDGAARVKRERPILVVLGNPPYNAFAGISPAEEAGLVEPYKEGLQKEWGIRKFNLDDLYLRFFRVAERRIAEGTGQGVVSFITNNSWLSFPSYVVMRKQFEAEFDRIWIDNLHGDRRITEYGPDGRSSETIFAMKGFSSGIRQGTAISLIVRKRERSEQSNIGFNDCLNASKADDRRAQLLASLDRSDFEDQYVLTQPAQHNRYSFQPSALAADIRPGHACFS
jgi:predicted helicase